MNRRMASPAVRTFLRHPLTMPGLVILGVLYFGMIFAEFVAPYHYDNGIRSNSYCPPSRWHFVRNGVFSPRPFVYPHTYGFNQFYERVWTEDTTRPCRITLLARGDRVKLWGIIAIDRHLIGLEGDPAECHVYLMGGDATGRDLFSRIVYGSRVSLTIGFVGVAVTFFLGFFVGGLSGYYGGKTDWILMRFAECFMLVPAFYLMLALRSAFPIRLSSAAVYFLIVLIMSFIGWAGFARVVRGMALSISQRDFVMAAKALGANDLRIIFRHVLPQTASFAIVSLTLSIPTYILEESALSLIGLGIQDPNASWGNLLGAAMNISDIQYHPWVLLPGVFIFLAVMAFNFLGDGLRDAMDPNK